MVAEVAGIAVVAVPDADICLPVSGQLTRQVGARIVCHRRPPQLLAKVLAVLGLEADPLLAVLPAGAAARLLLQDNLLVGGVGVLDDLEPDQLGGAALRAELRQSAESL